MSFYGIILNTLYNRLYARKIKLAAHAAAAVKFLHTLLLVGHVLGENPKYLLNPRVSRFALPVFQVTFCARFFDTKFGQFNFPCIGPIVVFHAAPYAVNKNKKDGRLSNVLQDVWKGGIVLL